MALPAFPGSPLIFSLMEMSPLIVSWHPVPCWSLLLLRGPGPTTFLIKYLEHTDKQHAGNNSLITTVTDVRLPMQLLDRDRPRTTETPPEERFPRT